MDTTTHSATTELPDLSLIAVRLDDGVAEIEFNRPNQANALNATMWEELSMAMGWASHESEVRVVILCGAGKHFSSGLDLTLVQDIQKHTSHPDPSRSRELLHHFIQALQASASSVISCRKPVLAAIQGACVGGAVDIAAGCDMRYAAENAQFSIKEVDLAIVADLGSLQLLPKLLSEGIVRELAYTGRIMTADEACTRGFVNQVFASKEDLMDDVRAIARTIAQKSPLTIRGIKHSLNYSRDHTLEDGLKHIASWNTATLLSQDVREAMEAALQKRAPKFLN